MVDLVDKGEAELQQLTNKVTMSVSSASFKASLRIGKGVAATSFKAAAAIYRSAVIKHNRNRESGEVSLKAFTQIAEGKRELVNIDDRAVSKQLERELRRHGVLWTVERHRDGSQTFHIQAKDAELIQHALTVAAERVDEKLARNAPEIQAPTPDEPVTERADEQPVFDQDQPDNSTRLVDHGSAPYQHDESATQSYFVTIEQGEVRQTLWGVDLERAVSVSGAQIGDGIHIENVGSMPVTLPDGTETHRNTWNVEVTEAQERGHTLDLNETERTETPSTPEHSELREEASRTAPEGAQPDTAVTGQGDRSIEREPALIRSEQRPEQTATDRTRAHVASKIDTEVKKRKSEIEQSKKPTKKHTPSRKATDEAQAPKANRR